ncbi:hypothetical protein Sjap_024956 [Stephania japonica]|uniref:Uncharacterized protein n=1 Tax=Stephania japonica TaxID=461633 RepID=A0AAP0EMZ8_9MAGN
MDWFARCIKVLGELAIRMLPWNNLLICVPDARERDSNEETGVTGRRREEIGCGEGFCTVVFESEEEETEEFVPLVSIRVEESLLISTIVDKHNALALDLFHILEEEDEIDIVFENQYRTVSRIAYTIQVKLLPDLINVELLEKKLCRWAGKPMFWIRLDK